MSATDVLADSDDEWEEGSKLWVPREILWAAPTKVSADSDDEDWPEIIHPEDWKRYRRSLRKSGGFDIEPFPDLDVICQFVGPLVWCEDVVYKEGVIRKESEGHWTESLRSAIQERNQSLKAEGKKTSLLELERVVKLNGSFTPEINLYYTFEARNIHDGTKKTYQALLVPRLGRPGSDIEIFREKGSSSLLGSINLDV